jgi:mannose-P-dolichol utilization defect protein 1
LARVMTVVIALSSWVAIANSSLLTADILDRLVDANSLVLLVSRVPQIMSNYAQKSTGQLSFITYFLNFMGTVARVFTTLQEPNATSAMMRGVLMSMTMNGLIVGQIVFYGAKDEGKSAVKKRA